MLEPDPHLSLLVWLVLLAPLLMLALPAFLFFNEAWTRANPERRISWVPRRLSWRASVPWTRRRLDDLRAQGFVVLTPYSVWFGAFPIHGICLVHPEAGTWATVTVSVLATKSTLVSQLADGTTAFTHEGRIPDVRGASRVLHQRVAGSAAERLEHHLEWCRSLSAQAGPIQPLGTPTLEAFRDLERLSILGEFGVSPEAPDLASVPPNLHADRGLHHLSVALGWTPTNGLASMAPMFLAILALQWLRPEASALWTIPLVVLYVALDRLGTRSLGWAWLQVRPDGLVLYRPLRRIVHVPAHDFTDARVVGGTLEVLERHDGADRVHRLRGFGTRAELDWVAAFLQEVANTTWRQAEPRALPEPVPDALSAMVGRVANRTLEPAER